MSLKAFGNSLLSLICMAGMTSILLWTCSMTGTTDQDRQISARQEKVSAALADYRQLRGGK